MDEYPIIDLSHLLPAAQGLARLPADERVQRIRADRCFVQNVKKILLSL